MCENAFVLSVGLAAAQGTMPLGGVSQRGNSSIACVSKAADLYHLIKSAGSYTRLSISVSV